MIAFVGGLAVLAAALATATTQLRGRVVVATVCALGAAATATVLGHPDALVLLPLAILGTAATVVDLAEGRLPDLLTLPLAVTTVAAVALADGPHAGHTLAAAVAVTGGAIVMKGLADAAVGWGDIKFVPTLAIVLARDDALAAALPIVVALVAITAVAVALGEDRRALVPFGPAMLAGTFLALVL